MARFLGSIPHAGSWFSFADRGSPPTRDCSPFAQTSRSFHWVADRRMTLLSEGDAVEHVEHGLAICLDDANDLRAPGLGAGEASQGSAKRSLVE
jgi:hypothetical protein